RQRHRSLRTVLHATRGLGEGGGTSRRAPPWRRTFSTTDVPPPSPNPLVACRTVRRDRCRCLPISPPLPREHGPAPPAPAIVRTPHVPPACLLRENLLRDR